MTAHEGGFILPQQAQLRPAYNKRICDDCSAAAHRGTSSKTPRQGNQPRQDSIICGCMRPKAIPLAEDSNDTEGLEMGWWIVVVVVTGIAGMGSSCHSRNAESPRSRGQPPQKVGGTCNGDHKGQAQDMECLPDRYEWFCAGSHDGEAEYQDVLNALAEDDLPSDAYWLMNNAGPDREAVLEVEVIADCKHVFAASPLCGHKTARSNRTVAHQLTSKADGASGGLGIGAGGHQGRIGHRRQGASRPDWASMPARASMPDGASRPVGPMPARGIRRRMGIGGRRGASRAGWGIGAGTGIKGPLRGIKLRHGHQGRLGNQAGWGIEAGTGIKTGRGNQGRRGIKAGWGIEAGTWHQGRMGASATAGHQGRMRHRGRRWFHLLWRLTYATIRLVALYTVIAKDKPENPGKLGSWVEPSQNPVRMHQ